MDREAFIPLPNGAKIPVALTRAETAEQGSAVKRFTYTGTRDDVGSATVRYVPRSDDGLDGLRAGIRKRPPRVGRALPLCLHVRNHSPTGFEWGYLGSGPAQLALALLVHYYEHTGGTRDLARDLALLNYQRFKERIVARFGSTWTLTTDEIAAALQGIVDGPMPEKVEQP